MEKHSTEWNEDKLKDLRKTAERIKNRHKRTGKTMAPSFKNDKWK